MSQLTCAEVEERDLEAAYLAGRLTDAEAEAYEGHYFGCDRCWSAVQRALEVRAAHPPLPAGRVRWPRSLAAAAGVALVVAAGWWATSRQVPDPADSLRGAGDSLVVRVTASPAGLAVAWTAWPGADRYRVRAFGADGLLLAERESADTAIALTVPEAAAYLDVTALDPLREPLAASGPLRLPPRSPP